MTTHERSKDVAPGQWNPWVEMSWPHRFAEFLENPRAFLSGSAPAGTLAENDTEFVLELDVPGVDRSDITVDAVNQRLFVRGNRAERQHNGVLRQSTVPTGYFAYEVALPVPVDESRTTARLADGILTVTVPKDTMVSTTTVEIG